MRSRGARRREASRSAFASAAFREWCEGHAHSSSHSRVRETFVRLRASIHHQTLEHEMKTTSRRRANVAEEIRGVMGRASCGSARTIVTQSVSQCAPKG